MRRERPGREARRVVGVKDVKSRRDRVNEGGTVKFEKACPVLEETEEEDGHRNLCLEVIWRASHDTQMWGHVRRHWLSRLNRSRE